MIYTSYFGQMKNFPDNFEPICVSRWKPKWYTGRAMIALAPSDRLLRWWRASNKDEQAQEKYKQQYMAMLNQYSPIVVATTITSIARTRGPDVIPVLVCFEKDGFCHRHLIAEWLNEHGIDCKEWRNE